jgi:dTMP kinase
MRQSGLFVTFEGIDGCGKSTQLALLRKRLVSIGLVPVITREPGGGRVTENIRDIILSRRNAGMSHRTELLLYLAARAENIEEVIVPALKGGRIVLCDRFSDSTFAYQGGGRGISRSEIRILNHFACAGVEPSITLLFDLPASVAAERLSGSGKRPDRLEKEGVLFQEKVRRAYLGIARAEPVRVKVLDARKSMEALSRDVDALLSRCFSNFIK